MEELTATLAGCQAQMGVLASMLAVDPTNPDLLAVKAQL
jgi:hypothetical protein